jgi:hypothetical protein
MQKLRKKLSAHGLLRTIKDVFNKNKSLETTSNRKNPIKIIDSLMSGLAIFGLKYPSLLQFDQHYKNDSMVRHNLSTLYGVDRAPRDTYMREILDEVDPGDLRKPFKKIFADVQRGNALEQFQFANGYYLISMDGTGFFSSSNVYCDNCCVKEHKNGSKTYYHQMFCAAIVHPNQKTVIPFAPEPIMKIDGNSKNDCEANATKRFIDNFRREHPHLKAIVVADSLSSKGPTIRELKAANLCFILGAKEGDHKSLYEFVEEICKQFEYHAKDGTIHQYRYTNGVPLNDSNPDLMINFLDYVEISSNGKKQRFTWVTDIKITEQNVHQIMKAGRARWKIENETFNTLKNQNYHFEHNYGHGKKNLSTVFAMLMMLAFLIDQVQELCDELFQQALLKKERKKYLWESLRSIFFNFTISSWQDLWNALIHGYEKTVLKPLNSA